MIRQVQKQVIFEEATKKGIIGSTLQTIPDIIQSILGVSDVGSQTWGNPMTPMYIAQDNTTIDIARISAFFDGLNRDLIVTDTALTNVETELASFSIEMYDKMEMLKNQAIMLSSAASLEQQRANNNATWAFSETLNTTNYIDISRTNLWIDTSQGTATLAQNGTASIVNPSAVTLESSVPPINGSFLGSSPMDCINGLSGSNWRVLFVKDGTYAQAVFDLTDAQAGSTNSTITYYTIDPLGYGINLLVELYNGTAWIKTTQDIIYNKTTFPAVDPSGNTLLTVNKVRITISPVGVSLPTTIGLNNILFFVTDTENTGDFYTTTLTPIAPYTNLLLNTDYVATNNSSFYCYYSNASGGPWEAITPGVWTADQASSVSSVQVDYTQLNTSIVPPLYAFKLKSGNPITNQDGYIDVGLEQIEVSAFSYDWAQSGNSTYVLQLSDFSKPKSKLLKAWSNIPSFSSGTLDPTNLIIQPVNTSYISGDSTYTNTGTQNARNIAFQRNLDPTAFPSFSQFSTLCVVPYAGISNISLLQPTFNYRMKWQVYVTEPFAIAGAQFWFHQGYRNINTTAYRDNGRIFGTVSLYVNNTRVIASSLPDTIFYNSGTSTSSVSVGTNPANSFNLNFQQGWNEFDLLFNIVNPSIYQTDANDLGRYLQFMLYPSVFDPNFLIAYPQVQKIVGSGEYNPSSQFDLLWNYPNDLTFWAWDDSLSYALFTNNSVNPIDGYFSGSMPNTMLYYDTAVNTEVQDLYLRFSLVRNPTAGNLASPVFKGYSIQVR